MPKVKVNGTNIYYQIEGQGEPLVMIMGIDANRTAWRFQIPTFRKHYHIVTFDNRGAGKSDKPKGAYSIKMMADDTVALMRHIGIERAHIVGVSMGGMIAQELAINYPEKVLKLVLVSTFATRDESSGISPDLSKALGYKERYSDSDIMSIPIRRIISTLVSLAFNRRLYKIILVPQMKLQIRLRGTAGLIGQMEAILEHSSVERLPSITVPTLVLTGSKDRVIKPSSSEVIANLIPNARLVQVDNGSHTFFIEISSIFNSIVLNFLNS